MVLFGQEILCLDYTSVENENRTYVFYVRFVISNVESVMYFDTYN